jgi:hypothetical protein
MTPDAIAIFVMFLVPGVHSLIRRFQDRFDVFLLHFGLFFIASCIAAAYAGGLWWWIALGALSIVAGVSQVIFRRP